MCPTLKKLRERDGKILWVTETWYFVLFNFYFNSAQAALLFAIIQDWFIPKNLRDSVVP